MAFKNPFQPKPFWNSLSPKHYLGYKIFKGILIIRHGRSDSRRLCKSVFHEWSGRWEQSQLNQDFPARGQEMETRQYQSAAQQGLCACATSQMRLERAAFSQCNFHTKITPAERTNNFRCIILHIRELHVFHIPIICHRLWRYHLAASNHRRAGAVLLPHPLERRLGARWRWGVHTWRRNRRLLWIGKRCFQLV